MISQNKNLNHLKFFEIKNVHKNISFPLIENMFSSIGMQGGFHIS